MNPFSRYQKDLSFGGLFPKVDGYCACGCGKTLPLKKRKWHDGECQTQALYQYYIIKGNTSVIRYCAHCGVQSHSWEADHIRPVFKGGGACDLSNLQTLCKECHYNKTFLDYRRPNSDYIHTASLNVIHPALESFGAFNENVIENIIRDRVFNP